MKSQLVASCFIIGTLLPALAAHADNAGSSRAPSHSIVKYSAVLTTIKARLAGEKMGSLAHIKVNTDNKGAVLLSGTARSQKEVDEAVSIACAIEGVTSVMSIIQIDKDVIRIIV